MPRRSRHLSRRGSPSPRPQRAASDLSPAARLRALVEESIIAAAALAARDDLERAAASTERLGALSSGMWRSLSRELVTAAERLDRSTVERLDDLARRAESLAVDLDDVMVAGTAAEHLEGHRDTLEMVMMPHDNARHLIGPNLLFGFNVDADLVPQDDEDEDGEGSLDAQLPPLSVRVWLYFWPAPLSPVNAIVQLALPGALDDPADLDLGLNLVVPDDLVEPLTKATGFSRERLAEALSGLGLACWTAHRLDEEPEDEEDEDEDEEADADAVSDEEDESLGGDLGR